MKLQIYYLLIIFLLTSCQKENVNLKPAINLKYDADVTNGGLFTATLSAIALSYQIDYGDGSTLETDSMPDGGKINLQHKYVKDGTYTLMVIVTNFSGSVWQKKEVRVTNATRIPVPNYKLAMLKNGEIKIDFVVNYGDKYVLDFGDGRIVRDSTALNLVRKDYPVSLIHQYNRNDEFKLQLSMSNAEGELTKSQTLNIGNVTSYPTADFSYELLDNGRVKFTNLSTNAFTNKWYIRNVNDDENFYQSPQTSVDVTFDVVGHYKVTLVAKRGRDIHITSKNIFVESAKSQMEFTGYYEGKQINGSLESSGMMLTNRFFSASLIQYVYKIGNWNVSNDMIKIYPLFVGSETLNFYNIETRYIALKKYLSEGKDPDIVEVTEEVLDPKLYNSITESSSVYLQHTYEAYPKAFWIKYKVKNEKLDGILKVRVVIR